VTTRAARGLLVCGTASNAGKTTVVAALCRALARRGVRVAPFKAQNMSLNSAVTPDGREIARAQHLQAQAAGVVPEAAMNPVLVKPGTDRRSHLVVNGLPAGDLDAFDYLRDRADLLSVAVTAYRDLASRFDVIVSEGAGSPAEFNLRAHDIANMGLAQALDLPIVLVADIDRGGVFASLIGSLACLDDADRARIRGFVINKFRGAPEVLAPGLDELTLRTGRPVFGVIPYDAALRLDAEDSLATQWSPVPRPPAGRDMLRIAVVRLPRASNLTDLEPLAAEPGVVLSFADVPQQLVDADLVILPGSRATVADLAWLREQGFEPLLADRAMAGRPILGICAGYQMLGATITDDIESGTGVVPGLGLLTVTTTFGPAKVLSRRGSGYQIHHGRVTRDECTEGAVSGTTWHGLFEDDDYRRNFLARLASMTGRDFVSAGLAWQDEREHQLDRLGDMAQQHLGGLVEDLVNV
jgi:adenosylcobyric acid synthase